MVGIRLLSGKDLPKLVYIMRTAGSEPVDTFEFLKVKCLEDSMREDKSSLVKYSDLDITPHNITGVYIAGYNCCEDGLGIADTRLLPNASYSLHLFATKRNAKIGFLVDIFHTKNIGDCTINKGTKDLGNIGRFISDNRDYYGLMDLRGENAWEFAKGPVINHFENSMYAIGSITNVRKKYFSHYGDITLHLEKELGPGEWYISEKDHSSAESLRTTDILFGKSLAGLGFRKRIFDTMDVMSSFADTSGLKYDSKNWLLLVKGV